MIKVSHAVNTCECQSLLALIHIAAMQKFPPTFTLCRLKTGILCAECHCTAKHVDKDNKNLHHKEAPSSKKKDKKQREDAVSKSCTSPRTPSDGDRALEEGVDDRKVSFFRKRRRPKEPDTGVPEEDEQVGTCLISAASTQYCDLERPILKHVRTCSVVLGWR